MTASVAIFPPPKTGRLMKTRTDCADILAEGVTKSGVYKIRPLNFNEPFEVYCDMDTDGGGWMVRKLLHLIKRTIIVILRSDDYL